MLFAILQKYEFSSKSQLDVQKYSVVDGCLRYCKSTSFQANHNYRGDSPVQKRVVCDTAKVRVFKQITTWVSPWPWNALLFAILQKYEFSSKSQPEEQQTKLAAVVCDTAKVRVFKQITTKGKWNALNTCCLRYCKSTSFQANHNITSGKTLFAWLFAILQKYEFSSKSQLLHLHTSRCCVVCDTAKVRVFKQITTYCLIKARCRPLFAILQKYEFSSKSQPHHAGLLSRESCLRYCKSTSFQANHNAFFATPINILVVCDTAKVRVFKQITTSFIEIPIPHTLFAILQKYEFSSKSQQASKL